jgi:translation initiation factor IF-1
MVRWQPGGDVAKEDAIVMAGTFVESLAITDPKIQIAGGHYVLAHISGNMRKHLIRIVPEPHRPGPHRPRTASSRAIVSRWNFPRPI